MSDVFVEQAHIRVDAMNVRANVPLFEWLSSYRRDWLRADVVAGLTTAAVVLPKSMAYATVAGLPIQIGLYTAFVPMIIYALLGTSRPLSVSTTTTLAILTGAQLGAVVPDGDLTQLLQATALLTVMVGVLLIAASVLRLGLSHLSAATWVVGVGTILGLVALERFRPRWPAPLIAVGVAIAGAGWFGWQSYGIELVGAIPAGLPAFAVPEFSLAQQLWPGALGIALMSFTETIAAGRAFVKSNEPSPRPNVELFPTGIANVGGALLGSMPAGGGTSQTAGNPMTGARTQIAAVVTALMTLVTMFVLAPLIGLMPHATLAGVVIVYWVGLISPADFRSILRIRHTEFAWAVAAFLGVMLLGTLQGIVVAMVISLLALGQQMANPPVYVLGRKPGTNVFRPRSDESPDDESFPGLLLLRLEGRLFFNLEIAVAKYQAQF